MRFDDYIMRMVEQLTQAIAHIMRLAKSGMLGEAETELQDAYQTLLGGDRVFLGMVDNPTLAKLVGTPEKARLLAQLSDAEATLAEQRGDAVRASMLRKRARELFEIAQREDPQGVADD